MIITVIAAEITSLFFIMTLILGTIQSSALHSRTTKLFLWLSLADFFALMADSVGFIGDGNIKSTFLLYTCGLFAYTFADIMMIIFAFYMISLIRDYTDVPHWLVFIPVILSALDIIMVISGIVTGNLFSIKDYTFVYGEWNNNISYLPTLSTIFLIIILMKYRRVLDKRKFIVLTCYLISPVANIVLQMIFRVSYYTYVISSVGIAFVYVEIQSEAIAAFGAREKILMEVSYNDSLTELKNRRAYEEFLSRNIEFHGNVGAVFCDLNSLKYTNDNFGHVAGDRLLKDFAKILTDAFSDGEIFRISGDEFVILLHDITQDGMDLRMQDFISTLYENGRMAACGYSLGKDADPLLLVKEAELKMYEDKSLYYKETGRDRRS
ncbi:MAG: GGDEF domain-containing protein [Lachnospiraceae bacterium]|nr:GGDEF domain-containing protein [Lachnospiraceae bacterium]